MIMCLKHSIKHQLKSFDYQYDNSLTDYDNVIRFLNLVNNVVKTPEKLKQYNHAIINTVSLKDISYHKVKMCHTESKSIIPGGIAGVVIMRSNDYWLIDGYHRFQWLKDNDYDKYAYIVLISHNEPIIVSY